MEVIPRQGAGEWGYQRVERGAQGRHCTQAAISPGDQLPPLPSGPLPSAARRVQEGREAAERGQGLPQRPCCPNPPALHTPKSEIHPQESALSLWGG